MFSFAHFGILHCYICIIIYFVYWSWSSILNIKKKSVLHFWKMFFCSVGARKIDTPDFYFLTLITFLVFTKIQNKTKSRKIFTFPSTRFRFSELSVSLKSIKKTSIKKGLLRSGTFWWKNHSRQICKNIQQDCLSDRVGGRHDQISEYCLWYFLF